MAAADSPDAAQGAADRAVFFDRADEVVAAGRVKAALPPEQRTQCPLIRPGRQNQRPGGESVDRFQQKSHSLPHYPRAAAAGSGRSSVAGGIARDMPDVGVARERPAAYNQALTYTASAVPAGLIASRRGVVSAALLPDGVPAGHVFPPGGRFL